MSDSLVNHHAMHRRKGNARCGWQTGNGPTWQEFGGFKHKP